MTQNSHPQLFLQVSALLTGFSEAELKATGMAGTYYNTVLQYTDQKSVDQFFQDLRTLLEAKPAKEKIESTLATQFMSAEKYSGMASNIIILWYTGSWGDKVVSAASYIQGLMWDAIHAHPPGAKQPGYGSWANLPLSVK